MFTPITEHTLEDGTRIAVGHDRKNQHMVVFDGPGGLETTIRFDAVDTSGHTIQFYAHQRRGNRRLAVKTGEIEKSDFGPVSDTLDAYSQGAQA